MTTDDQKQIDELASQRHDIAAERERLQQEIQDLSAKLFLVNHRERAIREGYPVATVGAAAGPAELESMGMNQTGKLVG